LETSPLPKKYIEPPKFPLRGDPQKLETSSREAEPCETDEDGSPFGGIPRNWKLITLSV